MNADRDNDLYAAAVRKEALRLRPLIERNANSIVCAAVTARYLYRLAFSLMEQGKHGEAARALMVVEKCLTMKR